MKINKGYSNIKVELKNWEGNNLAKRVYDFGRLSHDYIDSLPEVYNENNPDCIKLIDKIISGKTLPKFALQGHGIELVVYNMSRICLAQLTRDPGFFASASTGVFPLTQEFNFPLSFWKVPGVIEKITEAQKILESAYIDLCEAEIPSIEARYCGLHPQVISCTCRYTPADFAKACYSRTSSNFCDECNYVYRLMFHELRIAIDELTDKNSIKLWNWLITEEKCINDSFYNRERLYNSDFTSLVYTGYTPDVPALNDWRNSGWKLQLEQMLNDTPWLLTMREKSTINKWLEYEQRGIKLPTTYDGTQRDVLKNAIKETDYYDRNN